MPRHPPAPLAASAAAPWPLAHCSRGCADHGLRRNASS
jgi:hypothetical protein